MPDGKIPGGRASLLGRQLGPYAIQSRLGAGGMGEVYRARDTKLGRDVAIKILPPAFAGDADRLARFDREARLLASLNHSHIGAIYGLETIDGAPALVLELVDGDTLADRIVKGPLQIADALTIATQIALALEAAHERGIVHRDLKPANIKITSGGIVKVLDFGLAKPGTGPAGEAGAGLTHSPTMTIGGTYEGTLLGTAPYMSPEQARGKPVDKRTDVWAFGCVAFEMLTGRAAFAGETVSDTIARILEREPAWDILPDATPPLIRRVLHRCLDKDLKRRVRDIADVRVEIEDALVAPVIGEAEKHASARGWKGMSTVVALVVVAAVAAGAAVWNLKPVTSTPARVARFIVEPTGSLSETTENTGLVAISSDGRRVAYAAGRAGQQQLYVREVDQFESRPVPGTEGGHDPVFSPNGQALAFVADRKLKKVAFGGGAAQTLVDPMDGFGVSWGTDDTILYGGGLATGIWRVSPNGGTPTAVTTIVKELQHEFPELLPNGKALLFNSRIAVSATEIDVQSLETGQRRTLIPNGYGAHYLPTGHLVYAQSGTLMAVPFDPIRLEVTVAPVAVLDGISQAIAGGAPQVSFSQNGSMVYVPAGVGAGGNALVWVDRAGVEHPAGASSRPVLQPRLTPDGRGVSVVVRGRPSDVWEYDLARDTWSRLTDDGYSTDPIWTPDGRRITFNFGKAGPNDIYWKPIDGSGPAELLLKTDHASVPTSWSPDGRVLAFVSVDPQTSQDIWMLNLDEKGDRKARPFLQTRFREGGAVFSPDGKWVAYVSDESGRPEIYARPFPGPGEKWTISAGGGNEPVWARGAGQLFYRNGDAVMAVDIETTPTFRAGKPRQLFAKSYERSTSFWPNYDVARDGTSLLMLKGTDQTPVAPQMKMVLNWFEELKQRVPAK